MITPPVTVTVDGTVVASARPAIVERGLVLAPVAPFVERLAGRIESRPDGRLTVVRRERTTVVPVDVRAGIAYVALASVARGLRCLVRYDAAARVLAIVTPRTVVGTAPTETAPPGPYETFTPHVVATTHPSTPADLPRPRRTPILDREPR